MAIGDRYKTGENNPEKGKFAFDGYTDDTSSPSPTPEETEISLDKDETFPPIRSSNKACYWKRTS